MNKSPDAFRTISEVSEWLDTPAHVLRFWESRFSQVRPVKRAGGRRYYRPNDMLLLGGIKHLLHEDGLTIRRVQKMLGSEGVKSVAALSRPLEPIANKPLPDEVPTETSATKVVSVDKQPAQTDHEAATVDPARKDPVGAPEERVVRRIPHVDVPDDPPDDHETGIPAPITALLIAADRKMLVARRAEIAPIYRRLKALLDQFDASENGR